MRLLGHGIGSTCQPASFDRYLSVFSKLFYYIYCFPRFLGPCGFWALTDQGVGKGSSDKKLIDFAQKEITLISGQKAMITKSRKDISNFKLRKGMPVGVKVTLRGDRMYEFLDRLITAALPRVRDFKGISPKGFDGRGNYTLGIKEQIAFPEISIDRVNNITGMDITFVTNATSDEDARKLLTELGLPFKIKN